MKQAFLWALPYCKCPDVVYKPVGKCDGKWSYARAKKLNSIRAWSERKKEKHERISCSAKGNVCKNFDYF